MNGPTRIDTHISRRALLNAGALLGARPRLRGRIFTLTGLVYRFGRTVREACLARTGANV